MGTKLTYMPFIFQAVTAAIRKFPIFNAQASGDQIIYKQDIIWAWRWRWIGG